MRGILVVLAIIACCKADPGESDDIRIAPYHVMVKSRSSRVCDGSLLNKRFVITSISGCWLNSLFVDDVYTVKLGSNGEDTPTGIEIPVVARHLHEKYKLHYGFRQQTHSYDLAILKLGRDVTFDETIQPIALPKQDEEINDGMVFQALKVIDVKHQPHVFKYVNTTHMNSNDCRKAFGKDVVLTSDMLCVSSVMLDHENREHGRALLFNNTLMGVLSVMPGGFVMDDIPHIYAGIPKVVDWINKIIN